MHLKLIIIFHGASEKCPTGFVQLCLELLGDGMKALIVCNDPYVPLALRLIRSIRKWMPGLKIIIGDIGISDRTVFGECEFIKGPECPSFKKIHDESWIKCVNQKTQLLRECLKNHDETIILMDADQELRQDLTSLIDPTTVIQPCERTVPRRRRCDGRMMRYIGSVLIAHGKRALPIVDKWIHTIECLSRQIRPPYETPALCDVFESFDGVLKTIPENVTKHYRSEPYYTHKDHLKHRGL